MGKNKGIWWDFFYIGLGIGFIGLLVMSPRLVIALEGDNCAQTYALFVDVARALHSGEVSLWNPYLWGGFPNVGNFITESCYPINWILCNLFYDPNTTFVSYAIVPCNLILHLSIYFSGMYFLLKRIGFSRLNAFSTGVTSALCCSMFSYMYWLVYLDGFCWLPYILLCAIAMFEAEASAGLKYSVLLGMLFAVEASVSISLMLVISVLLFGFLFMAYLFGIDRRILLRNIRYSILAGALGILLAAPLLLSTLTFMQEMVRYVPDVGYVSWGMRLPIAEYSRYVCEPYQFWQMLDFHNNASAETPEISRVSVSAFVLLFCVSGFFSREKKNKKLYYISFFGFFVCVLACFGIVFPAAFYYVPGLNQLREAIMYGILANLFAGILAAYGFDMAERMLLDKIALKKEWRTAAIALAEGILLGYNVLTGNAMNILFAALAVCGLFSIFWKRIKGRKALFSFWTLLFVGLCMYDVYSAMDIFAYTETESIGMVKVTCENSERLVDYVKQLDPEDDYYRMTSWGHTAGYPENMAAVLGVYDVKGYLNPSLAAGIQIHTILPLDKRAQLQNIKYYLVQEQGNQDVLDSFEQDANYRKAGEVSGIFSDWAGTNAGTVYVYEAMNNLGDAWVVSDFIWEDAASQEEILKRIAAGTLDVETTAVVRPAELKPAEKEYLSGQNSEAAGGEAVCRAVSNNRITYDVNTGTGGILVTAEIYYPGWEVSVNGERGTVLQVDGTNRAVVVPEGTSVVEFRYRPWEIRAGVALQLAGLVIIGIKFGRKYFLSFSGRMRLGTR